MSNETSIEQGVIAAETALHEDIKTALEKFTESTGLLVPSVDWRVGTEKICGESKMVWVYWDFKSHYTSIVS